MALLADATSRPSSYFEGTLGLQRSTGTGAFDCSATRSHRAYHIFRPHEHLHSSRLIPDIWHVLYQRSLSDRCVPAFPLRWHLHSACFLPRAPQSSSWYTPGSTCCPFTKTSLTPGRLSTTVSSYQTLPPRPPHSMERTTRLFLPFVDHCCPALLSFFRQLRVVSNSKK